jgi:pyridoxal phosphate enzyme (YggS family)
MTRKIEISNRITALKNELGNTQLIAVSKYSKLEDIELAYESGQLDFGESKVIDLKLKSDHFINNNFSDVRWHFIGHLQTNKVKDLLRVKNLFAIHSIDSVRLLKELLKNKTYFQGRELHLFFQVNTSHEEEKSGFEVYEELVQAIQLLQSEKSPFVLLGLMTIGTMRTENFKEEAIRCFEDLNSINQKISNEFPINNLKLSMGMSQDYKIAVTHGSDYVRIGSAIFKNN